VTQPEGIDDAGRDRDAVLEGTADLDADHVVAGVEAQRRPAKLALNERRRLRMGRRDQQCRRQLPGDLAREAGTGQHDDRIRSHDLLPDHF
jgi:hypothetical protein